MAKPDRGKQMALAWIDGYGDDAAVRVPLRDLASQDGVPLRYVSHSHSNSNTGQPISCVLPRSARDGNVRDGEWEGEVWGYSRVYSDCRV